MADRTALRSRPGARAAQARTSLLVVLSLLAGLIGVPLVVPTVPAQAVATAASRWTFDAGSGTTAVDSIGSKPATLTSGAGWGAGIQGASGLTTNGSSGAAVTSATVLNTGASYTVSAWTKLNSLSGYQTVVSQDGNQVSGFYLGLQATTGKLSFVRLASDDNGASGSVATAIDAPVAGQWYHLVGVYNAGASTISLYVNGRLQQTVSTGGTPWNATGPLAIGRGKYGGNGTDYVNGTIDDVRVYGQALSASDVTHLGEAAHWNFDEGTGTTAADDTLNSFNATLTNGPTWGPGPVGPSSVVFDGNNDYVDGNRSVLDTSKSFTVSAWARTDSAGYHTLLSEDGTNVSAFFLQQTDQNVWRFIRPSADSNNPSYGYVSASSPITTGSWYHLTGVYDSVAQTLALYVNGVSQGTASFTSGFKASGDLIVGRARSAGAGPSNFFAGGIDDVRVFPYAIDSATATALAAPPAPPVPATPTATISGTTATVSWVAPAPISGSPPTGYTVTPYANGVAGTPVVTSGSATTQNFTGLTMGTSYRYTVAATNANGTSSPSSQSNAVTPPTVPGTPSAPTATAGSLSASVTWTAPASNGGSAITGYVVTPYVGGTAGTPQTFSSTATTQNVTGLTAGTSYTFTVAAVNAVGTGAASAASNAVTPNVGPTIAAGAPPNGQVGSAYSFTFTRTGGTTPFAWSVSAGTLPGGLTLAASTGVLSGTPTSAGSYSFTAKVTDTSGATDTKAVTLLVTDKPGSPAAPTATAGLGSAVLSWTAPASNGFTITSYVITPTLNGTVQASITVDPSAKTRTLNGLTAGGIYSFTIAAVNAAGTSNASAASNLVTPYAALNAPSVSSVSAGSTSATLSWSAPTSTGGSPITGYVVTPYIGSTAQTPQTFTGTATTRTVTGLTAGTAYTFTVAATNNSGTTVLNRLSAESVTAIDGGPNWGDNPAYRTGSSNVYHSGVAIGAFDSTVPATTPSALFAAERWGNDTNNEMGFAIPVTAGTAVKVRLYFANTYPGTSSVGARDFDVALDGVKVLPALDPVAAAGGTSIATMRDFAITSDGTVNIDFTHRDDSPAIYGIEIIQTGVATTGPASAASSAVTPNANPTLTFAAPPAAQVGVAYSQQLTVNGGTSPFTWSVASGSLPAGITLSAAGLLSGTPTTVGTSSFTVQVTDASGQTATRAVTLAVQNRPAAPAAPTATAGVSSATLSWSAPASNGSAITGYVVTPYLAGSAQTPVSFDASATTQTVTGLTPASSYTFTVAAVNAVGTSSASPQSNAVTPYNVPNAPSITAVTAGDLRVALSWSAPAGNGRAVTGYLVTPYIGGTAQSGQQFSSTATTQTITGLTAGTAYTFTVAAQNAAGTGAPSSPSASVTPNANPTLTFADPPAAVVGVAYSQQLTVTGGTSPFAWSVTTGSLPAGISLSAGGLLSGTPSTVGTSTFTVQVSDGSGQTATRSVTLVVRQLPSTPAAPTATAGLTSAVLAWTAPASNGSAIASYVITPTLNGTVQASITLDPSATTRTLNNLTAGGIYSFTVAAVNAAGTSNASAASNLVTPYAALNAPSVSSVSAGSTSATLSWSAPTSTGGSPITGYVVTPYIGSTPQTPQTFTGTATTRTVTGLTAGTAYTFTVAATNNSGVSWLYRNAVGGPQLASGDAGPVWAADTTGATRVNGDDYSNWSNPVVVDSTVPSTTPPELFNNQRFDQGSRGDGAEMRLSYPVATGTQVTVRLYFDNGNPGWVAGQRVFDVALQGTTVLNAFDPVVAAGGNQRGTMREFTATSDGAITIDFAHNPGDPILNGVEVFQTGTATTGPASAASTAVTPNASPTLTFAAPPAAQVGVAYSTQLTVNGGTSPFTWSVASGTLPAGITLSAAGLLSGTPTTVGTSSFTVQVADASGQTATRAVTLAVQNRPAAPAAPTATAGVSSATLSWSAPASNGSAITGYVVTPYLAGTAQTPVSFDASATTQTVTGLTPAGSYTFTVAAVNAVGTSAASQQSNAVTPYAVPNAPTITTVAARSSAVTLSWSAPSGNGSAVTGYLVTPYIGGVAQSGQQFSSTATTQTITGLTAGTAYTFTVAAQNAAGTGPASAASASVTPNANPTLTFATPPAGEVSVAYSSQLTVNGGTSPFTWSVSAGTLPAGITLAASTGLLSGTPTAAGTASFTVQVVDAGGQSATRSTSITVAAQPTVTFAPAAGEVNVGYSQTATVTGGTAPFSWALTAGSLPAGLSLNAGTGVVSGTPTAAGSFSVTLRVTDSLGQTAGRSTTIVIAPLPTLTGGPPRQYQQAGFSYGFTATGGTAPFSYAVVSGSLPTGVSLSSTGALTGQTNQGSYSFTVRATDAKGQTTDDPVTLVVDAPPIQLVKTASATSVAPGGTVTFTLTATNISSTNYGNTHVYDPLGDITDDATYNNDAAVTAGSLAVTSSQLDWAIGLNAGASATLTYTVTVANPDTGNEILTGQVDSAFASTSCSSGQRTSACTATVTVSGLSITKTASVASTTPGSVVTFTIVATNSGQTPFAGATLSDDLAAPGVLDDATYNGNAAATAGSVSYSGSTLAWTGNLAVGASVSITYGVTVANLDTGNRSLSSTVVSNVAGSSCPSGSPAASCTAAVPVLIPALSIQNVADVSSTTPGSTVRHRVTVTNTGQTAYTGATVTLALAGSLDDATYVSSTASAGTATYNAGPGTLVWTGNLALGAGVTIDAVVSVRDPDPGDKALTTVASSAAAGSTCPAGSTSAACTSTVPVLIPGLSFTTSADVSSTTPGSVVTYTVVVLNSGQTPATGAAFAADLSTVVDDATVGTPTTTSGTASVSGSTLSWSGDLAIGASATITVAATVRRPDPGDRSMTATITSSTPGSTCPTGGSDSGCASTVSVLLPGLSLQIAADVTTTTPGTTVHYTTTVVNTGETTYTNTSVLLDPGGLIDDVSIVDGHVSTGSVTVTPTSTVWTLTLAPGASATALLNVRVNDPDTGDRTLVNTVSSTVDGSSCPTAASAGCTSTVGVLVPGLQLTKTADQAAVTPGDTVTYTVTATNTGESTYTAAAFTDDLGNVLSDATYQGDAQTDVGTVAYAGSVLSWSGPLAPGDTATITYSVQVLDPDPGDKRMTNTLVSTTPGSNCAASSTDSRCTTAVDVLVPGLTIANTAVQASTVPSGLVTFHLTVTNSGATAYSGATVTAALAGAQDDAVVGGASADVGTVGITGATLSWSGSLDVGATATISYTATVNASDVGDDLITTTASSTNRGSTCAAASTVAPCAATVPVARLTLVRNAQETSTTPGSVVHVPVVFTNTGQVPYTDISVEIPRADTSDDVFATSDDVPTSGTLVRTDTSTDWTGDIPVGGQVTIPIVRTVKDPDTGNRAIRATLVSSAPGNNCPAGGADSRCSMDIPVLVPQLTITKTADTGSVAPGSDVSFTIVVHNTGETPYTGAAVSDSLTAVLDDGTFQAASLTADVGLVSYAGSTVSWSGDLAVGATATISYTVTAGGGGDKLMVNTATSGTPGSTCPVATTSASCRAIVVVLSQSLTITTSPGVTVATLGSVVQHTVQVTNSGQVPYAAAGFSDSLAGVLDDAVYDGNATRSPAVGTLGYASGVLSWTGALNPGDSVTITFSVTIDDPSTGDLSLVSTVTSDTVGSNCAAGSADTRCTRVVAVTNAVTLTLAKTADVLTTAAGQTVAYTVTATNSSDSTVAADVTDPLADVLDDADLVPGSLTASSGTASSVLTGAHPAISWSGNVAAGQTVTVTYAVTVHASAVGGDQVLTGTLVSDAPATSNNCLASSTDARCLNRVAVAALVIEELSPYTTALPGQVLLLSARFTNTGQVPYDGITIASPGADLLDDGTSLGDQSATSGTFLVGATAVEWRGNLAVGQSVTVSAHIRVNNPDLGNHHLVPYWVTDSPGSNCSDGSIDPRCRSDILITDPHLSLTKAVDTTSTVPGGTVGHTITVVNDGEAAYTGAVVSDNLAGVLDDATLDPAGITVSGGGSAVLTGSVLSWTGDVAVGGTVVISYSVTAKSPPVGDKTMTDAVSSEVQGSSCPAAAASASCTTTVAVLTPGLSLRTAADQATTVPGGTVTLTVTATNTGQTDYAAATFDVPLAGVLDDASVTTAATRSPAVGTLTSDTAGLHWTGALARGDALTVSYTVTVGSPDTGDHLLSQQVESASQGSSCPTASSSAACSSTVPVADLQIVNLADVATTQPTGVVHYTVTLTNLGQVAYTGLNASYSLVGAVDDAVYNGDATTTSGTVTVFVGQGRVAFSGDVGIGQTVTITGSMTVKNPDPGDKLMTTRVIANAAGSSCATGSADPGCVNAVTVLTPGLSISVAADRGVATPGSAVTYTITVTNTGQTSYAGATVTDSLPGVLNDASFTGPLTASSGTASYAAPAVTWTGDLAPGDVVTISYQVQVDDPDLGDKSLVDQVTSDALGSTCPTGGNAAACSATVAVVVPALAISVTADVTTTTPGSTVSYTVTVHNTGETAYVGASVAISLAGVLDDATFSAGSAATSAGTLAYSSPVLTWTGDLDLDGSATITYTVRVKNSGFGDQLLATSVASEAAGSTCTPGAPCVNSVAVRLPGLAITTTADHATATPGDRVSFTITITNTGQVAYLGATVSTSLTDLLDDGSLAGSPRASRGTVDYSAPTLTWTGSLLIGQTAVVRYDVDVDSPDAGNRQLSTTMLSSERGSTCAADTVDPGCTVAVTVLVPGLTIATTADVASTTPGGVVTFTVTITNSGETDYAGAVVSDPLGDLLTDADDNADATVVAGGGVLADADGTLTWTGDLAVGASATITFSVTVHDPVTGDQSMHNAVTSDAPGSSCPVGGSAPDCSVVVTVLVPGLQLSLSADTATVIAGDAVSYTVTLTNTGQTAYPAASFSDPLAAVLDDGAVTGSVVASAGTAAVNGQTLEWTGPVALGGTATITFTVTTTFPAAGDHSLEQTVISTSVGATCPPGACTSAVTVLVPELSVVKVADTTEVVAGGRVGWTITATNTGEAPYASASLTDSLAGVLDDASYRGDVVATSGTVDDTGGVLSWNGPLAVGASVTLTYSVDVAATVTGDGTLQNTVVSTSRGSSCPDGAPALSCTSSVEVIPVSLSISDLPDSFTLTGPANSTVTRDDALGLTVATNNPGGYSVTVAGTSAELTPANPTNPDRIPLSRLSVRENGASAWSPLAQTPTLVHTQTGPSAPDGDAVSNDYSVDIPFVASDTYGTTLEYIVTTQ